MTFNSNLIRNHFYYNLQMMGLAFEVHDSIARKKKLAKEDDKSSNLQLESDLRSIENPSAKDIFHYAFCHAGILTGDLM